MMNLVYFLINDNDDDIKRWVILANRFANG